MKRCKAMLATGVMVMGLGTSCAGIADERATDALSAYAQGLTAWAVYWDVDQALQEIDLLGENLQELVIFGAYYDEAAKLFMPGGLEMLQEETLYLLADHPPRLYLSIINDQLLADGGAVQKDPKLLYQLLDTPEKRMSHAGEILDLAEANGYDAVEIDYEGLSKDLDLWGHYTAFLELLQQEAAGRGIPLRVLLEPGAPLDQVTLPEGPAYVMMCYNLYGHHSGPGPKADQAFLQQMVEKMQQVPGEPVFALAGGGYDWSDSEGVKDLTSRQAREIAMEFGVKPTRDTESQVLFFSYQDEEGKTHEVWYADNRTLDAWQEVVLEAGGRQINLWRLGGNDMHLQEADIMDYFD